jgi:hypothetical protein
MLLVRCFSISASVHFFVIPGRPLAEPGIRFCAERVTEEQIPGSVAEKLATAPE